MTVSRTESETQFEPAMTTRREVVLVLLLFGFLALIFCVPVFSNFNQWGIQDWDQHMFYQAAPRAIVLDYGQFPLWNPFYTGGMPLFANPQSTFLSPVWLLVLALGPVWGLKLEIWLHLVIALMGTYLVARHYGLSASAAILAAAVFALSSTISLSVAVGMTTFLTIAFVPWLMLFFLKAFRDIRYAVVAGLVCVLMYFGGGLFPLINTLTFIAVFAGFSVLFGETKLVQTLKVLAIIGLVMFGVGAIKFLPSFELIRQYPRPESDYSGYSLSSLAYSLLSRNQSLAAVLDMPMEKPGFLTGISYTMDENGMYIGLIPFALFLTGVVVYLRRFKVWILTLAVFVWLSFGNRIPLSLWQALRHLPLYSALRVAQRFRFVFLLAIALLVALGFQAIRDYLMSKATNRKRLVQGAAAVLVGLIVADLIFVSSAPLWETFQIPPQTAPPREAFHQVWELQRYNKEGAFAEPAEQVKDVKEAYRRDMYNSWSALYPALQANLGTVHAYEALFVPRKATPQGSERYRGETYLSGTTGTAEYLVWSPNRLVIAVQPMSEGYLMVNQNYHTGWHVRGDPVRRVEAVENLLAVKVTPENRQVELYYLPTSFVVGAVISGISLILCVVILWKTRKMHSGDRTRHWD